MAGSGARRPPKLTKKRCSKSVGYSGFNQPENRRLTKGTGVGCRCRFGVSDAVAVCAHCARTWRTRRLRKSANPMSSPMVMPETCAALSTKGAKPMRISRVAPVARLANCDRGPSYLQRRGCQRGAPPRNRGC